MAAQATRTGSKRVSVYNEGLLVFLYDEAAVESLRAAGEAPFDFRSLYGWESEPLFRELAEHNRVVVYELEQDRGLDIEIVVGSPLTKRELTRARWHDPQSTRLNLPTGRLFIDSVNSFRPGIPGAGPGSEDLEPGGTVIVPPGEYALTLHRLFPVRMRIDGIATKGYASEVVVLTSTAKSRQKAPAPLFLPVPPTTARIGLPKYAIDDRGFRGKVLFQKGKLLEINFDRAAADRLGLTSGRVVRLTATGLELRLLFLDPLTLNDYKKRHGAESLRPLKIAGECGWRFDGDRGQEALHAVASEAPQLSPGTAVELVLTEDLLDWDVTPRRDQPRVDRIEGTIVGSYLLDQRWPTCVIDFAEDALQALQMKPAEALVLTAGGRECPLLYCRSFAAAQKLIGDWSRAQPEDERWMRTSAAKMWAWVDSLRREHGGVLPVVAYLTDRGEPDSGPGSRPQAPKRGRRMLHVHPILAPRATPAVQAAFEFETTRGTRVELRDRTP